MNLTIVYNITLKYAGTVLYQVVLYEYCTVPGHLMVTITHAGGQSDPRAVIRVRAGTVYPEGYPYLYPCYEYE